MNKNKGSACNTPGLTNLDNQLLMKNNSLYQNKLQHNSRREWLESTKLSHLPERKTFKLPKMPVIKMTAFVCDECARPLHLYGENFIETYINGEANILRCLCDLHADEFELEVNV